MLSALLYVDVCLAAACITVRCQSTASQHRIQSIAEHANNSLVKLFECDADDYDEMRNVCGVNRVGVLLVAFLSVCVGVGWCVDVRMDCTHSQKK